MPSAYDPVARRLTKVQILGICTALLLLVAVFGHAALRSPSVPLLLRDDGTPWIGAKPSLRGHANAWRIGEDPETVFERTLPGNVLLPSIEVRALRDFVVELDGQEIARGDATRWKTWSKIDLSVVDPPVRGVRAEDSARPDQRSAEQAAFDGRQLRVRVRNPVGPGLLQVRRLDGEGPEVSTASGWTVSTAGEEPVPAVVADDTRPDPRSFAVPRAIDAWRSKATVVAGLFALFGLASLGLRRSASELTLRRVERAAPFLLVGVWIGLLVSALPLPAYMGFDGPDHLAYVRFVYEHGALPLANDGAMMYHPPLFYVLSAAWLGLLEFVGVHAGAVALRIVPFASGIALVLLAGALARTVYPGDRARTTLAIAFVGLLPMNLYLASYLSNEGLHAALAACAIWLVARQLLADGIDRLQVSLAGAVLGLAVLTKATSLIYAPIILVFLALKGRLVDGMRWGPTLGVVALFFAAWLGVCGWFFARNQLLLGEAVIGNWDIPGSEITWWQHPGFHTLHYYAKFGDVLIRPFFAGFHSFWDGMYSTFWGDGLIGGIAEWRHRHDRWNYDYMTLVYGLALPATALGLVGLTRNFATALDASESPARRVVHSFLITTALATAIVLVLLTWRHPAYGMNKAFYALAVAGPVALFVAEGFVCAERWCRTLGAWTRVLYHAWAGTLAAIIALAFLA